MQKMDPDILRRYWEGKCTPAEKQKVAEWLAADEALPEAGGPSAKDKNAKKERLWQGLEARMPQGNTGVSDPSFGEKHSGRAGYIRYLRGMAAACALLAVSVLIYYTAGPPRTVSPEISRASSAGTRTVSTPAGQKRQVALPDGSTVVLNGGSSLTFSSVFTDTLREVRMERGEVYFDVVKDEKRPFIVHTPGDAQVRVLGTRFNIRSSAVRPRLEVTLTEGRIRFLPRDAPAELLHPGQQVRYDTLEGSVTLRELKDTEVATGWMENRLSFDDTPLEEVLSRLEQLYGVEFEATNGVIPDITFTATFRQEPLNRILGLIEQSTDLRFRMNGKRIILENKTHSTGR